MRIKRVVILGAGSAGLLAAVTFARRTPLEIEIIRSPGIGIIGVGEGTTHTFPGYLLNELRFDPRKLFSEAQPTWKLGLRFCGDHGRNSFTHSPSSSQHGHAV